MKGIHLLIDPSVVVAKQCFAAKQPNQSIAGQADRRTQLTNDKTALIALLFKVNLSITLYFLLKSAFKK